MEIKYEDLLKNAVTYFEDAVANYNGKKYRNAVSDLWAGILLLLKCKLFKINPCLIVEDLIDCLEITAKYHININKFETSNKNCFSKDDIQNIKDNYFKDFSSYEDIFCATKIENESKQNVLKKSISVLRQSFGFENPTTEKNLKTVTFDEILDRLKKLKEPNETYDTYKDKLRLIQKARNSMEHCICAFSDGELLAMFETTIPFINDYLENELDENAENIFDDWDSFLAINSIAHARKKTVEDFLNTHSKYDPHSMETERISECTKCGHQTIDIGDGVLYCKFCGNKDDYNICSECGQVIPVDGWVSFYEEIDMCSDCLDRKIERDK